MTSQGKTGYPPIGVGVAAAIVILSSLIYLASRALLPGDNSQVLLEEITQEAAGLAVSPLGVGQPFVEGDVISAVNDRSLASWLNNHIGGTVDLPELSDGQTLDYTLVRRGVEQTIPIQLEPYALGQAFLQRWSLYLFLFYLLAVSMVVFMKRPQEQGAQMFLLVSCAIFASGLIFFLGLQISDLLRPLQIGLWIWGSIILYGLLTAGLLHFALVFPYPSMRPKYRARLLPAIYIGVWIPYAVLVSIGLGEAQDPVEVLLLLARSTAVMTLIFFPLIFVVSVFKYRRTKSAKARRQMRWILWAFVIANVPWLILSALPAIVGEASQMASTATGLLWCLIPTAFAISILKEGLFDIDVIINRTLVYGVLTALLLLIYFGSVVLIQTLFTAVSGQQSAVAIVISTLVIAALFQPLRRRIQAAIDRRFYRHKYDSALALAQFAQIARDEVDLEQLTASLLQVAQDTLQPRSIFLWLPAQIHGKK